MNIQEKPNRSGLLELTLLLGLIAVIGVLTYVGIANTNNSPWNVSLDLMDAREVARTHPLSKVVSGSEEILREYSDKEIKIVVSQNEHIWIWNENSELVFESLSWDIADAHGYKPGVVVTNKLSLKTRKHIELLTRELEAYEDMVSGGGDIDAYLNVLRDANFR